MAAGALAEDARRRVPELDGLRGVAILLVLVRHYAWGQMEPAPGTAAAFVKSAIALTWSGVDLFFVLSGFLLAGVLLENRESRSYFRPFYVRRACRIVPLYYLMIAVAFAWTALVGHGVLPGVPFRTLLPIGYYLSFTQNLPMAQASNYGSQWLGVTWSLAIEEQFYLCLPLLVRVLAPAAFPYLAAALVLLAPALRMALFDYHPGHGFAAYVLMPGRADALMLGALIAWGWRHEAWRSSVREHRPLLYAAFGVLLAGAAVLTPHGWFATTLPMVYLGYSWLAVLFGVLLLLVLSARTGPLVALMRIGWLRGLGVVSYGVYLIHLPLSRVVHAALLRDAPRVDTVRGAAVTVLCLALSVGLATASWLLVERRIIRFGHSFRYQRDAPVVADAPLAAPA